MAIEKVLDVERCKKHLEEMRDWLLQDPWSPSANKAFENARKRLKLALAQQEFYSKQVTLDDLLEENDRDRSVPGEGAGGDSRSSGRRALSL